MNTDKELIQEVTNRLKETGKYLEAVKKSTENNKTFFFSFTELKWLIVESGYIEECIRNLLKKRVPGIGSFIKTNVDVIRSLNAKSEEFFIKSRIINSRSRVKILTEMMIPLILSLLKLYFLYEFKGISAKIEHLDEDKDSLILLSSLYEILRGSPTQKHHPLLEKMLEEFSILSYVPKVSELKMLVDIGFSSLRIFSESGVRSIDSYKAHQLDKPYDNFHTLSYDTLARDFQQHPENINWLILSKQHIIGIRFFPNLEFRIPQSINLLTKLKILIIDSESLEGYKKVLPLDNLPNQITSLTNLRILYIMNSELNEFPKEFAQLSHLRYIYILNSQLHVVPNFTKLFPKLRGFSLKVGFLKKTPDWLFEFARKHYSRRYIRKGVSKEDAAVLGLLEIISRPLERAEYNLECEFWEYNCYCGYSINELGRVTDLKLGFLNSGEKFYLLPCFPEEICKLRQLEKLYICNGSYSEENGFYYPHYKEKADAWIPESIRELKSLRYLCTNAKYSKSLKSFLESLEKFETDVFES